MISKNEKKSIYSYSMTLNILIRNKFTIMIHIKLIDLFAFKTEECVSSHLLLLLLFLISKEAYYTFSLYLPLWSLLAHIYYHHHHIYIYIGMNVHIYISFLIRRHKDVCLSKIEVCVCLKRNTSSSSSFSSSLTKWECMNEW
jgi:carbon starvation protein CstA